MKKIVLMSWTLVFLVFCSLTGASLKSYSFKGYRFQLRSLEPFDYSKRFEGRKVLGTKGEELCLRGTIVFETPLEETPISIIPVCQLREAVTDRENSLLMEYGKEKFEASYTNVGRMTFYITLPGKKDMVVSSIKGHAVFKVPVRKNLVKVENRYPCRWFPIYKGKACIIIMKDTNDHAAYVVVKYSKKNRSRADLLKLYLIDVEVEDKNIFWPYLSYTDSRGYKIAVFKTNFFFENMKSLYVSINDADYNVGEKALQPPFPKTSDINVFEIDSYKKSKKSTKRNQLFMISLPENRPRAYNWTYISLDDKRYRFSLKKKKGSFAEKKTIIFKEFTQVPVSYTIKHIGLFQAGGYTKKRIPFQFGSVPLEP